MYPFFFLAVHGDKKYIVGTALSRPYPSIDYMGETSLCTGFTLILHMKIASIGACTLGGLKHKTHSDNGTVFIN
jgi:hypothetical protein